MKKIFLLFFIVSFIALPFLSLAVDTGIKATAKEATLTEADVAVFVGNIIRAVLGLLGVLILIFILYGGFLWLTSGGNEQMVTKAKGILTSAAIGLIIVLASMAITTFVMNGVTGATSGSSSSAASSCYDADINPLPSGTSCEMGSTTPGCCDGAGACRECP